MSPRSCAPDFVRALKRAHRRRVYFSSLRQGAPPLHWTVQVTVPPRRAYALFKNKGLVPRAHFRRDAARTKVPSAKCLRSQTVLSLGGDSSEAAPERARAPKNAAGMRDGKAATKEHYVRWGRRESPDLERRGVHVQRARASHRSGMLSRENRPVRRIPPARLDLSAR